MKRIKIIHIGIMLFMLFGMTGCDYFDKSVYTIEKESYQGSGVSKDTYPYSIKSYNHPFKSLESCLKETHILQEEALSEYKILYDAYTAKLKLKNLYSSLASEPKKPKKYGCVLYKESDISSYEDKYKKLFPN